MYQGPNITNAMKVDSIGNEALVAKKDYELPITTNMILLMVPA